MATGIIVTSAGRRQRWRHLLVRAHLFAAILWLDAILTCSGQKPINLGGVKKRDVYIAGFFPYGNHVPECHLGRGVMPSVKLAVDHINENQTVLRNYRLHMWWNDTECNAAVGVKAFFDMMHSGPHKVMLFGAACTQVTDPIAKASRRWRLTQNNDKRDSFKELVQKKPTTMTLSPSMSITIATKSSEQTKARFLIHIRKLKSRVIALSIVCAQCAAVLYPLAL
ncbi:hypothetical protein M0804_002019 [Polistes exclamans]|nr:hypothetical protein M0804_002019 [Polistes exclamans]